MVNRRVARGLSVLAMVFIVAGCAGQLQPTAVPPATAPRTSTVQAVDPVAAAAPSITPSSPIGVQRVPETALPTARQGPTVRGGPFRVGGHLLLARNTATLTETYDLQVYLESDAEEGSTSPVTITFAYEGIVVGTSAPTLTLVVTPGLTIIPTTVKLQDEGQGRIIATFTVAPSADAHRISPCLRNRTLTDSLVFLATPHGVLIRKSSDDVFSAYLEHAHTHGILSNDVYKQRIHILHSDEGRLIIDLTGGRQSLKRLQQPPARMLGDDLC